MGTNRDTYTELTEFFQEEYPSMKGYVRARLEDAPDNEADDIIQDVALRIFAKADDLATIQNIAAFVYRSIRNRIIDVMRTRKQRQDSGQLEVQWTAFAEQFYGPNRERFPEGAEARLQWAIGRLKPPEREIILAVDFEGHTYRELAEKTGIPQGTLMSRRHRALAKLFTLIASEPPTTK